MFIGIQHVQLSVAPDKLQASRDYYIGLLGMVEMQDAFPQSGGFWMLAGPQEVHIRKEENIDRLKTRAHTAFLVLDLPALQKKLEDGGYPIYPQPTIEGFDRFHTVDPSGNRLEFMQRIGAGR